MKKKVLVSETELNKFDEATYSPIGNVYATVDLLTGARGELFSFSQNGKFEINVSQTVKYIDKALKDIKKVESQLSKFKENIIKRANT